MHACFLYSMLPPTSPRATACPATPHLQKTLRFNFFPQRSTLLRPSGVRGKMHRMWIIVATCSELNERLIRSSTSVVLTSGTKQLAEYSYVVTPISSSVEKTILLLLVSGAGAFLNQVFMYSCLFVYPTDTIRGATKTHWRSVGETIIYTSPPAGNSHARHKAGRQRKESRHRCCFSQQSPTHHTALHCIRGRNQSIAAHNHLPPSRHSAKKSAFSTKAALGQLRSNQN